MRLKNKIFLLLFFTSLLPLLVVLTFTLFLFNTYLERNAKEKLSRVGALLSTHVQSIVKREALSFLEGLSNSPYLLEEMEKASREIETYLHMKPEELDRLWKNLSPQDPLLSFILNNPLSHLLSRYRSINPDLHAEILAADRRGFLIGATRKPEDFYQGDEEWFKESLVKGSLYLGNPRFDKSANLFSLSFAFPIGGEKKVGVLKVVVSKEEFFRELEYFSLGETGFAHLLDKKGKLLVASKLCPEKREFLEKLFWGKISGESIPHYVVYTLKVPLPGEWSGSKDWYIMITQKKEEIFAPLSQIKGNILYALILSFIIIFPLSQFFARRLTLPLAEMQKVAKALSMGKREVRVRIRSGDELESLSQTLNNMADKLVEALNKLEEQTIQLKRANQIKSRFLSAVSHEFKTPLTIIHNFAYLLLKGKLGNITPSQKEKVERILKFSDYLARLVDNLIHLSRLESGDWETERKKFSLRKFLEKIYSYHLSLAEGKKLTLTLQLPSRLPYLYMDSFALEMIMNNLVENAIKFTSEGGKVIIRAERERKKMRIEVEDTGVGIPEGEEEKIFEPFYRVEKEEITPEGAGLGLSIVKGLVDMLGGEIKVRRKEEGGSIFTLKIPLGGEDEKKTSGSG